MIITNELGLPKPLVNAVNKEYKYKDKQFSATGILGSVRELILKKRHNNEIVCDVADMAWSIFGTAVHQICENSTEDANEIKEAYLIEELPNGYKLSGRADLYNETEQMVTDYKTCSSWKIIFKDYEDWKKQLLIYGWLIKKLGFECNKGQIVAFLKDHSITDAKTKADYPKQPIQIITFNFTDKDYEEIEKFILDKFYLIEICESLKDEDLPMCTDEERWYTGDKFAVKKKGNVRALRVYDTEEEAIKHASTDSNLIIEYRKGVNKKCENYCNACKFCNFYKNNVEGKENE